MAGKSRMQDGGGCAGSVQFDHLTAFTAAGQSHGVFCRFDLQLSCRAVQPRAVAAAATPALSARYGSVLLRRLDKRPSFWLPMMRRAHSCLISHAYPGRSQASRDLSTTVLHQHHVSPAAIYLATPPESHPFRHSSMLLLRRLVFRGSAKTCRLQ